MGESVHTKYYHDIDAFFGFHEIAELVFLDDFLWYVGDFHSDVFGAFERSVEVKVGDVRGHKTRGSSGNHTVKQNLGSKHVGSGCGDFTGVVDHVAAHN